MPESFDHIDPLEDCEWVAASELFRRVGFNPLPPAALDDFQLKGRLWEFIYTLAGLRFYLHHSDHLSDRELYTWLHDEWLYEEVADIGPEVEWNCRMDMTDGNNGTDPIIWLQYFATEQQRLEFAAKHNLKSIPAHVDPPFDRDRWLPEPPGELNLAEIPDEDLGDDFDDADADPDPLGLAAADAAIRAEQNRHQNGEFDDQACEEMDTLAGVESEGWQRPIDQLNRSGVSLLPPDELTDETLTARLWELLHTLACGGFYVMHTNHFSDRELYTELWQKGIRDEALLPGKTKTGAWYHDFIGGGGEEDIQLNLRYYAPEEERSEHSRDWPDISLPSKETAPYNRDWRLPRGPF
ncbi:MAG: hypothetical protein O2960_13825 [Verrucomicrobia bacterium]|nr:hypothetical protein [Verrucomicrobiota bacterium]